MPQGSESNKGQGQIKAKLADGTILLFPEGTEDSVIDAAVLEHVMGRPETISHEPSTMENIGTAIKEQGPAFAGGVAAGIATGGTSIPMTALAVTLGAVAGESYRQLGLHLVGSPSAPKTSTEAAKLMAEAGMREGGGELVGGYMFRGGAKLLGKLKPEVTAEIRTAMEHFRDRIKPAILLPAEASESRIIDILQNIAESSLIGGGSIAKYKRNRLALYDKLADEMVLQFGERMSPDELGELLVDVLGSKTKAHKAAADVMYNAVADIIERTSKGAARKNTPKVSTAAMKEWAAAEAKRSKRLGGIEAKNAGDDLLDAVLGLPDQLEFVEAQEFRSRMISRADEFSVINKKAPAIGKAKRLANMTDQAIEQGLMDWKPPGPPRGFGAAAPAGPKTVSVYHGRTTPLRADSRHTGLGIHLTEDLGEAKALSTGEHLVDEATGTARPAKEGFVGRLDINPDRFIELEDMTDWELPEVSQALADKGLKGMDKVQTQDDLWKALRANGYDGIKYTNAYEAEGTPSYIVNPKRYKEIKYKPAKDVEAPTTPPEPKSNVVSLVDERKVKEVQDSWDAAADEFATYENARTSDQRDKLLPGELRQYKADADDAIRHAKEMSAKYPELFGPPIPAKKAKDLRAALRESADAWEKFAEKYRGVTAETAEMAADRDAARALSAKAKDLSDQYGYEFGSGTSALDINDMSGWELAMQQRMSARMVGAWRPRGTTPIPAATVDPMSKQALDTWRMANDFYKTGRKQYNNAFLRRLIKMADETGTGAQNIAPAIFRPGAVAKVRMVKAAVGDQSMEWSKLQGFFMEYLQQKATDSHGVISGEKLINLMYGKPNSFGLPVLNEVLPQGTIRELEHFARVLRASQTRQAEGAGRMLIQLTQAGAVGTIFSRAAGNAKRVAATIILAPPLLAKMMLNPRTARMITNGIQIPESASQAGGILSRIVAAAYRMQRRTSELDIEWEGKHSKEVIK